MTAKTPEKSVFTATRCKSADRHYEDEENADYGRVRMYQALKYRKEVGKFDGIKIPCEATVLRHY